MSNAYDETKAGYVAERQAERIEPTMGNTTVEEERIYAEAIRPPQPWMVEQATIERDEANLPEQQPQEIDAEAAAYERVHHPQHYNLHPSGVECIDIIEHMPFNIGAAIKHLWRAGIKPDSDMIEDYDKALFYIQREQMRVLKVQPR